MQHIENDSLRQWKVVWNSDEGETPFAWREERRSKGRPQWMKGFLTGYGMRGFYEKVGDAAPTLGRTFSPFS